MGDQAKIRIYSCVVLLNLYRLVLFYVVLCQHCKHKKLLAAMQSCFLQGNSTKT